jgi:hypothetical protein
MQFQVDHLPCDMGRLFPPDSHESKLTFRLTVPVIARVLHLGETGLLIFYGLAGIALLYMALKLSEKITGSRRAAFFVCLAIACVWAGETSFHELYGGVYDGVALCLVLLALSTESALLAGASLFLATWTDERALIASAFVLLCGKKRAIAAVTAGAAYVVTRLILTKAYSLAVATGSVGFSVLQSHAALIPIGFWTGLGGAWIIVVFSVIVLFRRKRYWIASAFCGLLGAATAAAFLVMDVTRTMAYCLPAVFIALGILVRFESTGKVGKLVKIAGVASVLTPTFFVMGNTVLYLYPLPVEIIRWFRYP